MEVVFTLNEIDVAARQFLLFIGERKLVAFHGEMGAGKTTFIHAICNILGVQNTVGSPTYSIINEYGLDTGSSIYHMDLYRLKDEEEAFNSGVEDCLYSGKLCLVEWPEKAANIFPSDTVHCHLISTGNNERKLQINL